MSPSDRDHIGQTAVRSPEGYDSPGRSQDLTRPPAEQIPASHCYSHLHTKATCQPTYSVEMARRPHVGTTHSETPARASPLGTGAFELEAHPLEHCDLQ